MSTIIRWNPFREVVAMQNAMDRLFEDAWRGAWPTDALSAQSLPLDVHETDSNYTVSAALPGVNSDQVNVKLHDGVLTINVELPQPTTPENTRALLQERVWGKFSRTVSLPQPVNADKVEATFENGVLTLVLPKTEAVQPRLINIKTVNPPLASKN